MLKEGIVLICSMLVADGAALAAGHGGYAGAFLQTGMGARPLGMGNSFTAISDDATAVYWNPAGLTQVDHKEICAAYGALLEGRHRGVFGLAYPSAIGALGLGWMNYTVGGISRRDRTGQEVGKFSDSENALFFSYARGVGLPLDIITISCGGTAKVLYHTLADNRATGFGADLGMLIQGSMLKIAELRIGLAVQNLGASLKWNTVSGHRDRIPTTLRGGLAIGVSSLPLYVSFDLEKNTKQDVAYHVGTECWFHKILGLRAGYDRDDITAGVSFRLPLIILSPGFDYGFSTDPVSTKGVHRISARITF